MKSLVALFARILLLHENFPAFCLYKNLNFLLPASKTATSKRTNINIIISDNQFTIMKTQEDSLSTITVSDLHISKANEFSTRFSSCLISSVIGVVAPPAADVDEGILSRRCCPSTASASGIIKHRSVYPKPTSIDDMPPVRLAETGKWRNFTKDKYGKIVLYSQSFWFVNQRYEERARRAMVAHSMHRYKKSNKLVTTPASSTAAVVVDICGGSYHRLKRQHFQLQQQNQAMLTV